MEVNKSSYQVNTLLSISRLPDHFYALVNDLEGHDAEYKNPGVALRSYVVSHCLHREIIQISDLPDAVLKDVIECEQFSTSGSTLSKIVEMLLAATIDASMKIAALPPENYKQFITFIKPLSEIGQVVKMSFDAFILTQDPAKDYVDIMSMPGIMLKATLFDLQDLLDDVTFALADAPTSA